MADLILTLASLKNKADAVGVGTTASSSTPNLCPTKSAIPGYVTNGNSTVSISGTYASNQLVRDADVTVSRTQTGTGTIYQVYATTNYECDGGDIPASGGQRRGVQEVVWNYKTRTYYSDGTYEDEASWHYGGSTYIYGPYVSGSDLGNTKTSRTLKGYSKPTGTVKGIYIEGPDIPIYQEANTTYIAANQVPDIRWNTAELSTLTVDYAGGYVNYPNYYPRTIYVHMNYKSGYSAYATIYLRDSIMNIGDWPGYDTDQDNFTYTIYKYGTSQEIYVEPTSQTGNSPIFVMNAQVTITLSDGTQFQPATCTIKQYPQPSSS